MPELDVALGEIGGLVPLVFGNIAAPVEYFDVSLPAGYGGFLLRLYGLTWDNGHPLCGAFSYDGGTTFACDASNFDTYRILHQIVQKVAGNATSGSVVGFGDSVMYFTDETSTDLKPITLAADIDPGNASGFPSMTTVTINQKPGTHNQSVCRSANMLNTAATSAPANGRVNLLRVLPYGNGDADPPTSGAEITAGKYHLFGVPLPA